MKYFLFADTMTLYAVPKKYWQLLDIINGGFGMGSDYDGCTCVSSLRLALWGGVQRIGASAVF